ncbi:MAG: glycosyltransferase [Bacteroidales bacterium]|nr:glycosyltransferase [Bacteroidales bacterium]
MKILQFCNKPPYPPKDGGAIGMHNVSQGFIDSGYDLHILSVNSDKHFVDIAKLPQSYIENTKFKAVKVDLGISVFAAFSNLIFFKRSYNIERFFNKKLDNELQAILESNKFDIIQIESVFLKDYLPTIRKYSDAKVVLRAPNVEFMIWQRLAFIEKKFFKRLYLNILAKRLKREELIAFNSVDAIYTVTENDASLIKALRVNIPIEFVPTGIDVTKDIDTKGIKPEFPSLFHLGALDWMPNQESIKWLLDNVWPELHKEFPKLKFYIAGRKPPQWILDIKMEGVEVVGEVDDAAAFIKSKAIMPVPLFSGSGMRVKIIEGMMLKKAIVSTSIGIEGIIHEDKKNVLIANNAQEFNDSIRKLIWKEDLFNDICFNARENAKKHYSNNVISKKLNAFLLKVLD